MKFLINTITRWDEPPRARHQIAQTLCKKYPVHFVSANKTGWPKIKKRQFNNNLCILTPSFPVPFKIHYRLPVINEIYQRWLFGKLIDEFQDHSVINFDFSSKLIYKYFKNVIYYCNDNFSEISKRINPKFIVNYHKNCERFVAEKAKFYIATTKVIKDNIYAHNRDTFEIHLGGPNIHDFDIDINYNIKESDIINVGLVGYIRGFNLSHKLLNNLVSLCNINFPEKSVYIAKSYDNFLDMILKAYDENDPELLKKRISFSKDNSWDNRIEYFITIYNKFFN